ncbi:hypothetical protein IFVP69_C1150417 [Vibrio parahaemolyticus]
MFRCIQFQPEYYSSESTRLESQTRILSLINMAKAACNVLLSSFLNLSFYN